MWSEAPRGEGEYISLALGSLDRGDLHDLGELGLLPQEEAEKRLSVPPEEPIATRAAPRVGEGLPWFEAMIEGSALGRVKVRRGLEEKDGRRVEWEVVEWYQARGTLRWAARGEVPGWFEVSGGLGWFAWWYI